MAILTTLPRTRTRIRASSSHSLANAVPKEAAADGYSKTARIVAIIGGHGVGGLAGLAGLYVVLTQIKT